MAAIQKLLVVYQATSKVVEHESVEEFPPIRFSCTKTDMVVLATLIGRFAADTGAVPLFQRFGSALNLNIHFHMIFLGGV